MPSAGGALLARLRQEDDVAIERTLPRFNCSITISAR
jgi:hypothetical protein